jgi:hypothetical protein
MSATSSLKYEWATALDFIKLEKWVLSSVEQRYVNAIKSQMLCDSNMLTQPLNSITCDCVSPDGAKGIL